MTSSSLITGSNHPEFLREETLADVFKASAQKYETKPALIFDNQSFMYAELDNWSNEIANDLLKRGITTGSCVGVWMPRSVELHVAILGIVKAGATYVPMDREMPEDRVIIALSDIGATACFSDSKIGLDIPILSVLPIPATKETTIPYIECKPDSWAYILYTSGSTGKPKGIPITHRQICHLIRSENSVLGVNSSDKVYQGFSVSFDMWCEETWISYLAGATLWVADATTAKVIDELSDVLRKEKITVLHAVPSLLAVMEDDIPTLRLINAGGEACTKNVLEKWGKEGRPFYNSYGPTETTVTATLTSLKPGNKITIGTPLPNYGTAIVDEQFNIVPVGERGELVISGPGVCNGYINLPELTIAKFLEKPASLAAMPGNRIYRTGDAAIINSEGNIEFEGRLDDQIKLRGYRIELGEIESRLAGLPEVAAAAVAVKKDNNDQEQLVGYVLLKNKTDQFDDNNARTELAKVLAPYMIPGTIMQLDEMPRLPSGKINRRALPVPAAFELAPIDSVKEKIDITAPLEDRVSSVLHKVFPNRSINIDQDFFTDLGGHSLLAASFVSHLRKEAGVPQASLKDVYTHRPIKALIQFWGEKSTAGPAPVHIYNPIPWWRHTACWIAQTMALPLIFGLFALQLFLPYLGYYYVQQKSDSHIYGIITAFFMFCIMPPLFSGIGILTKWLVLGKMKEGDYPLWGQYYFRWWFVKTVQALIPIQFLNGTPLYPVYLKFMGVKISPDAQLSAMTIGAEDLVTIGEDVSISSNAMLNNAYVEDGLLKLRKIHLGDHAYIGSSAIVGAGATIEDWGELKDLSYLQKGKTIKIGEVWQGSPAQIIDKKRPEELPQPIPVTKAKRTKYKAIYWFLLLIFPFAILLPLLPVIVTINELDIHSPDYDFSYLVYTPFLTLFYLFAFALMTIVLTRVLQKNIKPGTYPIYSKFYLKKWFADQLISLALIVLHPIYATVFIADFFRGLGAKVGKNSEISTASSVTHPLLEIGDGAFIADAVTLGETDVRGQQLILDTTSIGNNSFVGNSALIPQGYKLGDNMLIGVLSTPPNDKQLSDDEAKNWFGSPAIALPRRQESNPFPKELTTDPSSGRKLGRGLVELLRSLVPQTAILCFSILFIAYCHDLIVGKPIWQIILMFPLYYLFFIGIPAFLVPVALKWLIIGRYKKEQIPMWTWKVWRNEALTVIYEALAVPFVLEYLKGTPWLPILLRILGVKTGKRIWMNTTDITEYGMVTIGDEVALNDDCGPQTHLFEDRVMKIGPVKIGSRSTIGARSIILYDSEIGDNVVLDPLSLVMKGENLPDDTAWMGSPVRPATV